MTARLHRIRPIGGSMTVEFVLRGPGGERETCRADLAGLVALTPVLEPLTESAVFETVRLIDDGVAAAWDAPDAEVSADLLAMIAREQTPMDAVGFKRTQEALGLTNEEMGAALGTTDRTVKNYRSGRSDVPPPVRFVLRRFLEDKKLLAAHLVPSGPKSSIVNRNRWMPLKREHMSWPEISMPNYTIDDFWKRRLSVQNVSSTALLRGWSFQPKGHDTFKEAPLTKNEEFGDSDDPEKSSILLVSAAGAVGKSTLARQIAFATGAVYIDLGMADPVGGNTLSGGLVRSGLYEGWKNGSVAILIDGLDEARLRVTQEAFEAFLSDIAEISKDRTLPTVMFGRTGASQDAWLIFAENGIEVPVLEIGYYSREDSVDFAESHLRYLREGNQYSRVDRQALELLLDRLREQTESDGDRFAGYAPVLQAVAERVAKEGNPASLVSEIKKGEQLVTLRTIVLAILERERTKLERLPFEHSELDAVLYTPQEQLDRLVARVYQLESPELPEMNSADAEIYSHALDTWVAEHPFLDGNVAASSSVFDAVIAAHALQRGSSAQVALRRELGRGAAANPFLSEFYLPDTREADVADLPAEHIGVVYSSLRSRLAIGDTASLSVEGVDDGEDEDALRADVEITLARRNVDRPRMLRFRTVQVGPIYLGTEIEDVDLSVPHSRVEIGPGAEAVLVAPINIQCAELSLTTEKIVVEGSSADQNAAVYLEAGKFDGEQMTSVPILRGNVSLSASWPNVRVHPWTNFATAPSPPIDPRVDEALRRLRKFVIAFRSHGRGILGRYRHKIEHERMTKGAGQAVLDLLIKTGILELKGSMYFLDPGKLAAEAGTNYGDCMARRFGQTTIDFVHRALEMDE